MTGPRDRRIWSDPRADADDEVAFHLEMRERDFRERGLSPPEARAEARRRFGNPRAITKEVRAIDVRSARLERRTKMWRDARQDVGYAIRGLRRAPGFTFVAVLTLALGIGANTAIFGAINSALLRPLPFTDSGRLAFLWNRTPDGDPTPLGPGRMMDFRAQATSFSGVAAISHMSFTLTGSEAPELISGSSVSSSFFDVLGARPLLGDFFHGGQADPSAVVLGHSLWVRRFGSDRTIVGRTIVLNGRPRLVVAVTGPDFYWPFITARPTVDAGPDLWVPGGPGDVPRAAIDEERDMTDNRNAGYIRMVARLKPGVTQGQADAEVRAIGARLSREHPEDGGRTAMVVGLRDQFFGSIERPLFVLGGAVAFVLAIACANVASLLLGRGAARRRDLALRRALGAVRSRIVRQLLTEALVLAALGGAAGTAVAWWGGAALARLTPPDIAGGTAAGSFDMRVLGFTLLVTVVSGLAFGVVPALQFSRGDLTGALAEGSTRSSDARRGARLRDALVTAEIAVAFVLLVGAALLTRSFLALSRVDVGLDTHNLLTFSVSLTGDRGAYQAQQVQFYEDLQRRLEALPGVIAAGSAVTLPIGGDDFGTGYLVEGRPMPRPGYEPHGGYQVVMPGFFHAMGIPLKRGRDVRLSDTRTSAPIALVNETLARQQWPGEDPVGRRVRFSTEEPWMTIVGVVGDIRHLGPSVPPRPEVYQPASQRSFPFMAFVVRTAGDPQSLVPSIRRAVAEIDPALPIADVKTMDEHVARALARPRFISTLVAAFGAVAVTLAVIGIYGLMAWSVAQRRQEIAIRMALGARKDALVGLVLRKALALAAAGVGAGLLSALAAAGVLRGLLFGVEPTDPSSYALTTVLAMAVAVAACYVPARRAVRVDPAVLLR